MLSKMFNKVQHIIMLLHFVFYTCFLYLQYSKISYIGQKATALVWAFFHVGFTFFIPAWVEEITGTLPSFCYQKGVQKFCDTNAILPAPKTESGMLTSF